MKPILYGVNASNVRGNGFGILSDCISCTVTEELNGAYTAEIVYPADGIHFDEIRPSRLVLIQVSYSSDPYESRMQFFRVFNQSRPMENDGKMVCSFFLRHISYDLDGIAVKNATFPGTAQQVMRMANETSYIPNDMFEFYSDISGQKDVITSTPMDYRKFLVGSEGSVVDVFGGELYFNNYVVELKTSRAGSAPHIQVDYGRNIAALNQEQTVESIYTHVLPFAVKVENYNTYLVYRTLNPLVEIQQEYDIGHTRILPLDLTEEFKDGETITSAAVGSKAAEYIAKHNISKIIESVTCDIIDLNRYKELNVIENKIVRGGMADVSFEKYGIRQQMKIVRTVFDSLAEEFTEITMETKEKAFIGSFVNIANDVETIKKSLARVMQVLTPG